MAERRSSTAWRDFWRSSVTYVRRKFSLQGVTSCGALDNNEEELDRQNVSHLVIKGVYGRNFEAPVEARLQIGGKVLDIGSGSGTWLLEIANEFPNSKCIGIDIDENVVPTHAMPSNCDFEIASVLQRLPFEDKEFDYIHCRHMLYALKTSEWPIALKELRRVLKPGGYLECTEWSLQCDDIGPETAKIQTAFVQSLQNMGYETGVSEKLPSLLKDAGFTNTITCESRPIPIGYDDHSGPNSKYIGELTYEYWAHGMKTMIPVLTNAEGGMLKKETVENKEYDEMMDYIMNIELRQSGVKQACRAYYVQG